MNVVIRCANEVENGKKCNEVLNITVALTELEIKKNWAQLVLSSPLVTKKCPRCNYSTYGDCNIRTNMFIWKDDGTEISSEEFFNMVK